MKPVLKLINRFQNLLTDSKAYKPVLNLIKSVLKLIKLVLNVTNLVLLLIILFGRI